MFPLCPSTIASFPSRLLQGKSTAPITVGIPIARPSIARCEFREPFTDVIAIIFSIGTLAKDAADRSSPTKTILSGNFLRLGSAV